MSTSSRMVPCVMSNYSRLAAFYGILPRVQARTRALRAKTFVERLNIRAGLKVIDLGGSPAIWQHVTAPLDITLVNLTYEQLTSLTSSRAEHHKFTNVVGDACDVKFASNSFDLVFSNSVIEHVGDRDKRAAFAREVRRLAPRYWVQTPAKSFPLEAHSGMPFWWYYPPHMRANYIKQWKADMPLWAEMVETTALVEKRELLSLFPEATIFAERYFGLTKSYTAYKR
jgi:hypothetical protein